MGIIEDAGVKVNMVEASQRTEMEMNGEAKRLKECNHVAFPKKIESLLEFLHRFQRKNYEVMIFPRCSSIFDKKVAENIEGYQRIKEIRNQKNVNNRFTFDKRGIPRNLNQ